MAHGIAPAVVCFVMPMLFNLWLLRQIERRDDVGQLVRLLDGDQLAPMWSSDPERYRRYLAARRADAEVVAAFEKAVTEWRQAQRRENER